MSTVLVVDDEPDLLLLVELILADDVVFTVGRVADVRPTLAASDVDLLLADVSMPDLGGPELVRELRAEGLLPDKVLLMSAIPPTQLAAIAEALGVDHLSKPFSGEELKEAVDRLR